MKHKGSVALFTTRWYWLCDCGQHSFVGSNTRFGAKNALKQHLEAAAARRSRSLFSKRTRREENRMTKKISDRERLDWLAKSGPWTFHNQELFQLYQGDSAYANRSLRGAIDDTMKNDLANKSASQKKRRKENQ